MAGLKLIVSPLEAMALKTEPPNKVECNRLNVN